MPEVGSAQCHTVCVKLPPGRATILVISSPLPAVVKEINQGLTSPFSHGRCPDQTAAWLIARPPSGILFSFN